jgi:hypothetical protein
MPRLALTAMILALGFAAAPLPAQTIPATVNYQGRLTDNGTPAVPVNGVVNMKFEIWDAPGGGSRLWLEPAAGATHILVNDGIFNVLLGASAGGASVPIPATVFTGGTTRYLQITANNEVLTPRQTISATGYANQAQSAALADDSNRLGGALSGAYQKALAAPSCPASQFLTTVNANGSSTCATPPGFTGSLAGDVTGPQGATVVGKIQGVAVAAGAPALNQVLKYSGTQWQAAAETDPKVGALGNNFVPKWNNASGVLASSQIQDNGTSVSIGSTSPSVIYQTYNYRQQLTANGDGQTTLMGYRTRDSQNDGISYAQISANDATRGFNFWGDVYTFGVGGWNYNDYNRTGGTFGSEVSGTYWGSLGYRSSGLLNYGVFGSSAYASGAGLAPSGTATGIGGGFYGDLMGGWVRGDVMGLMTSGTLFSAYNVGNVYTEGSQVELVPAADGSRIPYFPVSATESKVYSDGTSQLSQGTAQVSFGASFAAQIADGKPPTVTISPVGAWANLYVVSVSKSGFVVAEAGNGASTASFNWIAVANRAVMNGGVPAVMLKSGFRDGMQGVMFNEGNRKDSGKAVWWDGTRLQYSEPPSLTREQKDALLAAEARP